MNEAEDQQSEKTEEPHIYVQITTQVIEMPPET